MMRALLLFITFFLAIGKNLHSQTLETAPGTYIIFLKDKKHTPYNINHPSAFLTAKAMERRAKQGIEIDSADLPVSPAYIDSLQKLGLQVYNTSRWLNTVTVKTYNPDLLRSLETLNFISKVEKAGNVKVKFNNESGTKFAEVYDSTSYGLGYKQIHIHNGDYLHNQGFRGEGVLIAVIDAGFYNYQTLNSFQNIIKEGRIIGIRDFIDKDGDVNNDHTHGMHVLSIIGGEIENSFIGTAPKADFLLLRSENASGEYQVEEDNWVAAAEFADSLGADVINTSLGYTTFDNPLQNHNYSDMDGATTRVTRAAEIAAMKGMIVVVSAGNEGTAPWHYISAPADAENILTVGAVNSSLVKAPFSSVGPTADNRIKPDVMAIGQGTFLQTTSNTFGSGNGTSFSAPVIAGLTACLWQAAHDKTNMEVMSAIRKSSNRFEDPDNNYGYGIPDFKKALFMLNPAFDNKKEIRVYPNPFLQRLNILYKATESSRIKIEIFNSTGRKLYTQTFQVVPNVSGVLEINDFGFLPRGIVIVRATAGNKTTSVTAIKL